MINPREYQIESLESVSAFRDKGVTRQLISLPTGCGKTVVFALLAKQVNTRTLVLAHTEELITQAVAKFKIVWPEVSIGIVKAEFDEVDAQVVVASIQTATREKRLQKLKKQDFGLMIIDEAHHATALSYENVIRELGFFNNDPSKILVGVTATLKRGDGIGLGSIFQAVVFERSIGTMIRAGYLAPLLGKVIFTKVTLQEVGIRHGDFVSSELARVINIPERNQLIVDSFKTYANDRKKSLAFCVNVQHAKDLSDSFKKNGISSASIYGSMKGEERKAVLKDFSSGKYQVLTNCQLLTEGFDEPGIDCVIMSRPTQSSALYTQMIGRGTRTFPTKLDCFVLDFTDNTTKHTLCSYKNTLDGVVAHLNDEEGSDSQEAVKEIAGDELVDLSSSKLVRIIENRIEDIEFFEKAYFAWNPIGNDWHLALSDQRDIWVRLVKGGFLVVGNDGEEVLNLSNRPLPLDYALGVAEDWARKQSSKSTWARKDAEWRSEPASQKQLETLSKMGVVVDKNISKGQASQLLGNKLKEPATDKQIYWLSSRGISVTQNLTKSEAGKLIRKRQSDGDFQVL